MGWVFGPVAVKSSMLPLHDRGMSRPGSGELLPTCTVAARVPKPWGVNVTSIEVEPPGGREVTGSGVMAYSSAFLPSWVMLRLVSLPWPLLVIVIVPFPLEPTEMMVF